MEQRRTSNGVATSGTSEDCTTVKKFTILFENGKRLMLSSLAHTSTDTCSSQQLIQQGTTAQQSSTVNISAQPATGKSKNAHEEVHQDVTGAWLIDTVFEELEDCLRTSSNDQQTFDNLARDCAPKIEGSVALAAVKPSASISHVNVNVNATSQAKARSRVDLHSWLRDQSCLQVCNAVAQHNSTDCLAALVHVLLRQSDDYSDLMLDEEVIRYEAQIRASARAQSSAQLLDSVEAKKAIVNGTERTIGELPVATVWKLITSELLANRRIDESSDSELDDDNDNAPMQLQHGEPDSSRGVNESANCTVHGKRMQSAQAIAKAASVSRCTVHGENSMSTFDSPLQDTSRRTQNAVQYERISTSSSNSNVDMSAEMGVDMSDTSRMMPVGTSYGLGISSTASASSDCITAFNVGRHNNQTGTRKRGEDPDEAARLLPSSFSANEMKQVIDHISLRPTKLATLKFDTIGRVTSTYKRERIKEIMDQLYENDQPISGLIVTELLRKYDHLVVDGPTVTVLMREAGYKHTEERYRWVKTAESQREDSANTLRSLAESATLRYSDPVRQRFKEVVDELARSRKIVDVDAVIGELAREDIQMDECRATEFMRELPYMKFNSAVHGWIRLDQQLSSMASKRIRIKRCIDQLLRSGELFLKVSRIASLLYESGWKSLKKPSIAVYVQRVLPTLEYIEFHSLTRSWRLKPGAHIPSDETAIPPRRSLPAATSSNTNTNTPASSTCLNESHSTPKPRLQNKNKLKSSLVQSVCRDVLNANSHSMRIQGKSQPARFNTNAKSNSAGIDPSRVSKMLDVMYSQGNDISVNKLIDNVYAAYHVKLDHSSAIRLMDDAGYEKVGPAETDWALCLNNKRDRHNDSAIPTKRLRSPGAAPPTESNATVYETDGYEHGRRNKPHCLMLSEVHHSA